MRVRAREGAAGTVRRTAGVRLSYAVDGRQYVAVAAGNGLFVYALRE